MVRRPFAAAMLIAAWPSAAVAPRINTAWPGCIRRIPCRATHAVAYDSGMAANSSQSRVVSTGTTLERGTARTPRNYRCKHVPSLRPWPEPSSRCQAIGGIELHDPDALDPGNLGHGTPGSLAKVDLCVVDAERFDPDQNLVRPGYRRGPFLDGQHLGSAVVLDYNGSVVAPGYLKFPVTPDITPEQLRT
jgi:hypothetical protein